MTDTAAPHAMNEDAAPRQSFFAKHRKVLLGVLAVAIFVGVWQAAFLIFPFNPLFISKPNLIGEALFNLLVNGDMLRDLAISAVPFLYGFVAAVVVGVSLGVVMGWRSGVRYTLDPLMTIFYASPLVALAPLVIVFFGVGVSGKAIIIFMLAVFPFIFNTTADGNEAFLAFANANPLLDRPVTVTGLPFDIRSKNSALIVAVNKAWKLIYLFDDNILFENYDPKQPKDPVLVRAPSTSGDPSHVHLTNIGDSYAKRVFERRQSLETLRLCVNGHMEPLNHERAVALR